MATLCSIANTIESRILSPLTQFFDLLRNYKTPSIEWPSARAPNFMEYVPVQKLVVAQTVKKFRLKFCFYVRMTDKVTTKLVLILR